MNLSDLAELIQINSGALGAENRRLKEEVEFYKTFVPQYSSVNEPEVMETPRLFQEIRLPLRGFVKAENASPNYHIIGKCLEDGLSFAYYVDRDLPKNLRKEMLLMLHEEVIKELEKR